MNYGLVAAGYNNDLKVDEEMVASRFANILLNGSYRINPSFYKKNLEKLKEIKMIPDSENHKITRDEIAQKMVRVFTSKNVPLEKSWETAVNEGLVDNVLISKLSENRVITNGEGYYWAASLLSSKAVNG